MPLAFLSYSSKDRELAVRIRADLERAGISVWIDEGEILVGDSISRKIQEGLSESEYLVLLLTPRSVASRWVEMEWQSQLVEEADTKKVVILPVVGEQCQIPQLLRDKRYANLSKEYSTGIQELITSIQKHAANLTEGHKGLKSIDGDPFSQLMPIACTALAEKGLATRRWRQDEIGWCAASDYQDIEEGSQGGVGLATNLAFYIESKEKNQAQDLKLVLNINNTDTREIGLRRMAEAAVHLFKKMGLEQPAGLVEAIMRFQEEEYLMDYGTVRTVQEITRIDTLKMVVRSK